MAKTRHFIFIMTEHKEGQIEKSEKWNKLVREKIAELLELIEIDFFDAGEHYGLEQFLPDPEKWGDLTDSDRRLLLKSVGETLGVDILAPQQAVARQYREEGVLGEPSEGEARVDVLTTNNPQLELHVFRYDNLSLDTRYNIVRKE